MVIVIIYYELLTLNTRTLNSLLPTPLINYRQSLSEIAQQLSVSKPHEFELPQ